LFEIAAPAMAKKSTAIIMLQVLACIIVQLSSADEALGIYTKDLTNLVDEVENNLNKVDSNNAMQFHIYLFHSTVHLQIHLQQMRQIAMHFAL
jgi:hypothetical protein